VNFYLLILEYKKRMQAIWKLFSRSREAEFKFWFLCILKLKKEKIYV